MSLIINNVIMNHNKKTFRIQFDIPKFLETDKKISHDVQF